jgi:hypothetical protein
MVRIEDIPHYLHSSELYKSLQESCQEGEDRGHFDVPDRNLKQDQSVRCEQDARHLLTTLRYWGVKGICDTVAMYLMSQCRDPDEGERLVAEFGRDFPYLEAVSKMVGSCSMLERFGDAVSVGSIEVIEFLRERDRIETGEDSFLKLVGMGASHLCAIAASNNQLECLKYMFRVKPKRVGELLYRHSPGGFELMTAAAAGGVECLRFLHSHGLSWNAKACSAAASAGKLECLQYLHGAGCLLDKDTCTAAAAGDHLDCLQYAHEHGCPLGDICIAAARAGSLACLQYAHEHGAKWDERVTRDAAKFGHQACLMYARDHGCPYEGMPRPVRPKVQSSVPPEPQPRSPAWFSGCWTQGAVHPEAKQI